MTDDPFDPFAAPDSKRRRRRKSQADPAAQYVLNGGDPFVMSDAASTVNAIDLEAPSVNTSLDPFAGGVTSGYGGGPKKSRTGVIVGVTLVVVVLAGLGAGGWFVWHVISSIENEAAQDSWGDGTPGLSKYAPDLESFDAVVGETVNPADLDVLEVGVDMPSGIYVAQPDGSCFWTVQSHAEYNDEGYFYYGHVEDGETMAVVPHGYFFEPYGCGVWTAIDPADALPGSESTVLREGTSYIGRDAAPGAYLLPPGQGSEYENCYVVTSKMWGLRGPGAPAVSFWADDGTIIVDVEIGDTVSVLDCPELKAVDAQALVAQDQGKTSFEDGTWLVGVDVQSGTYQGSLALGNEDEWCSLGVWADSLKHQGETEKGWFYYGPGDEPPEVLLEVGDTVESRGCSQWDRTGP